MIYFIRLLIVNLFLFIVTKAENATYSNIFDEDTTQRTGRIKRAPFHRYIPPRTLSGMIKDGNDNIHIKWQKVKRHLWNENVPVYTAHLNPWGPTHFKRPQIMKNIGKLIVYHSTTHKSVLIYSENYDRFYGIVDKRYYIAGASLDQLLQLEVDGRLVKKFPPVIHKFRESPNPFTASKNSRGKEGRVITQLIKKPKLDNGSDMVFKKFYIEILVFITYDIYKYMDDEYGNALEIMIFKYLIHFYAVDMVFAQLPKKDFRIYLNLAGFIVEVDNGVFSNITRNPELKFKNGQVLDVNQVIESFKRYPNEFGFPFKKDSYDLIYLSTSRQLITPLGNVHSLHSREKDIFAQRLNNYGRSFVPMAVVQVLNTHDKYIVSAHEIARSVAIYYIDPAYKGTTVNYKQCYGIMQDPKVYCPECITWSDESIKQLKRFLSYDRNRCFLLNKPRSLLPFGTPLQSLSPCSQCQCFGYGCHGERKQDYCSLYIPVNNCNEILLCKEKIGSKLEPTILPLDGTPCGHGKVCWDEKCVNVPTKSGSK